MAVLIVSGGEHSSNKYGLFKEYYNTIFKREKQKKVSILINDYESKIHKIHNALGFRLQHETENLLNTYSLISKTDFEMLIISHLKEDEWNEHDISKFVEEFRNTITHRLVFISEVQEGKIGFVVRSLQEFFAANYYMDAPDTIVKEKISSISFNSYWRNTLLFSIGYIKANKEHLINDVYSLCEVLNGDELGPNESDYRRILKLGSQLSLDILSEGILNDSPRYVNRFSRLLEPLITSSNYDAVVKFNRLQNRIKDEWILGTFQKNLDMPKLNYWQRDTVFSINAIFLNSQEPQIKTKALNFLNDNFNDENLYHILVNLFRFGEREEFFFNILLQASVKCSLSEIEFIITECINENTNFINYVFKNHMHDYATIKAFIEKILLIFVYGYSADDIELKTYNETFSVISGKHIDVSGHIDPWAYLSVCQQTLQLVLGESIILSYNSIIKDNVSIYEEIKEIALKFDLDYFVNYCNYNINPSKINAIKFIDSITNLPTVIKNKFIQGSSDWFLKYCLDYLELNKSNNYKDLIKDFGDTKSDLVKVELELISGNNVLESVYFANQLFANGGTTIYSRKKLMSYFVDVISTHPVLNDMSFIFYTKVFDLAYRNYSRFSENTEMTKDVFNYIKPVLTSTEFIKSESSFELWVNTWSIAFQCDNLEIIFNTVTSSECFKIMQYGNHPDTLIDTSENSLKNIFQVFNSIILLKIDNSFIRFVRYIIFSSHYSGYEHLAKFILDINFKQLNLTHYSEIEDQMCKFQIMMLAPTPYLDDEKMLNLFEKYINYNNNFFKDFIQAISYLNLETLWQKNLILKLTSRSSVPAGFFVDFFNAEQIRSIAESIPVKIV